MKGLSFGGLAVIGASFLPGRAAGADGGAPLPGRSDGGAAEAGSVEGGASCGSSDDCSAPTPYCHSTGHFCAECLGDRNCADGEVCDAARGVCTSCRSDADCPGERPYCAAGECVECKTDTNCGDLGLECTNGLCGSCGDGICGPREVIVAPDYGPFGPEQSYATQACEDCLALCPTVDLEGAIDVERTLPPSDRNLFETGCGTFGVNDVSIGFTAPADGTYYLAAGGPSGIWGFYIASCSRSPDQGCAYSDGDFILARDMKKGEQGIFVVESEDPTPFTVKVLDHAPPMDCGGAPCPGSGPDAGDAGGSSDQGYSTCIGNAKDRGEPVCDGTECACQHCPQDYDDCGVIPGCDDVRTCMRAKGCIGTDCYLSGACRGAIDSHGGLSGGAFRAAASLQSCSLTFECALPCGGAPAPTGPDASAPAPDGGGSVDAGRLCEPEREVVCACEGGLGRKRCEPSGQAFSECQCEEEERDRPAREDDGCGCRVARPAGPGLASWLGAALLAAAASRRARRSKGTRS